MSNPDDKKNYITLNIDPEVLNMISIRETQVNSEAYTIGQVYDCNEGAAYWLALKECFPMQLNQVQVEVWIDIHTNSWNTTWKLSETILQAMVGRVVSAIGKFTRIHINKFAVLEDEKPCVKIRWEPLLILI